MLIRSITLNNYRLYKGENTLDFSVDSDRNIVLVAGENGFGKTTLLSSLIWCLYGRQIGDVEPTLKKETSSAENYLNYLGNNLNRLQRSKLDKLGLSEEQIKEIKTKGYTEITGAYREYAEYSVTIVFSNISISSFPCETVTVKRSYDILREEESLETFIDDNRNVLYKGMGDDLFINDYILNRNLARFFFFDSEKIVSMAEMNTLDDKRKLNSAYNEVLGLKKYEDLRRNLENLRIRFKKRSADEKSRDELIQKDNQRDEIEEKQAELERQIAICAEEIRTLKKKDEALQIELIRESNTMTIESLKRQKRILHNSQIKDVELKGKLRNLLDFAPFAIAGKAFFAAKKQVDEDYKKQRNVEAIQLRNDVAQAMRKDLMSRIDIHPVLEEEHKKVLRTVLQETFGQFYNPEAGSISDSPLLIEVTQEQYEELQAIYINLTETFKLEFETISDDYRKNRQLIDKTNRRIASVTPKEGDLYIQSIRIEKDEIEDKIKEKEELYRTLSINYGMNEETHRSLSRRISELSKIVSIDGSDAEKDEIAGRLIDELDIFLENLRKERKSSLEERIKICLNKLMHKEDFIDSVKVNIMNDLLEIQLYDEAGRQIQTETLSKGEQQLYATSLLKALVDESGIQFPVFIDSPLQKFDKRHSGKIIREFYPTVSRQVVLMPLLQKELTEEEYDQMLSYVKKVYYIKNKENYSFFKEINPEQLFKD